MTILVTGAGGDVAGNLIPLLLAAGREVKALVRSPDHAQRLRASGAAVVLGDFRDKAGLAAALDGVETIFLLTPAHAQAADMASTAIEAARQARVRRIVRLSAIKAAADGPTDNTRQHWRTEEALRRSGIAYTILRPHFYMQNLLGSVQSIREQGAIYFATAAARIGMIDVRDIADAAARVILDERWDGAEYEITGPAAISYPEVAERLSKTLGRKITYVPISPDALAEAARGAGMDEWSAMLFRDYNRAYGSGWGDFVTSWVSTFTGRPARSFDSFAAEVLAPAIAA